MGGSAGLVERHATFYVEDGRLHVTSEPGAVVLIDGEPVDLGVVSPTSIVRLGLLRLQA